MTRELLHAWLDESPEHTRVFQEEGLILDATEEICEALEKHGLSRSNLADRLGTSNAYVTQLLNGNRNMTLRTFASIAFALDMVPRIELKEQISGTKWTVSGEQAVLFPEKTAYLPRGNMTAANDDCWSIPQLLIRDAA